MTTLHRFSTASLAVSLSLQCTSAASCDELIMVAGPSPAVVIDPLHQRDPWVVIRIEEAPCILPRSLQGSVYTTEDTCYWQLSRCSDA